MPMPSAKTLRCPRCLTPSEGLTVSLSFRPSATLGNCLHQGARGLYALQAEQGLLVIFKLCQNDDDGVSRDEAHFLKVISRYPYTVACVSWSKDGRWLAAGIVGPRCAVHIFDAEHDFRIAFDITTSAEPKDILVVPKRTCQLSSQGAASTCLGLARAEDGGKPSRSNVHQLQGQGPEVLLILGGVGGIQVHRLPKELSDPPILVAPELTICKLGLSLDNSYLAAAAYDGRLEVWVLSDILEGTPMPPKWPLKLHEQKRATSVAFSPCGRLLAVGSWDKKLSLFLLEDGQEGLAAGGLGSRQSLPIWSHDVGKQTSLPSSEVKLSRNIENVALRALRVPTLLAWATTKGQGTSYLQVAAGDTLETHHIPSDISHLTLGAFSSQAPKPISYHVQPGECIAGISLACTRSECSSLSLVTKMGNLTRRWCHGAQASLIGHSVTTWRQKYIFQQNEGGAFAIETAGPDYILFRYSPLGTQSSHGSRLVVADMLMQTDLPFLLHYQSSTYPLSESKEDESQGAGGGHKVDITMDQSWVDDSDEPALYRRVFCIGYAFVVVAATSVFVYRDKADGGSGQWEHHAAGLEVILSAVVSGKWLLLIGRDGEVCLVDTLKIELHCESTLDLAWMSEAGFPFRRCYVNGSSSRLEAILRTSVSHNSTDFPLLLRFDEDGSDTVDGKASYSFLEENAASRSVE